MMWKKMELKHRRLVCNYGAHVWMVLIAVASAQVWAILHMNMLYVSYLRPVVLTAGALFGEEGERRGTA